MLREHGWEVVGNLQNKARNAGVPDIVWSGMLPRTQHDTHDIQPQPRTPNPKVKRRFEDDSLNELIATELRPVAAPVFSAIQNLSC